MTLQELLGDELYAQVKAKLDEVNAKETDQEKHVRYEDLSEGNYISKLKYDDIVNQLAGKDAELTTANDLITELKKGTKGNEELQGKITNYETDISNLQAELQETKIKSAVKVALLSEKAVDVDYLTFKLNEKLKEKGESLELDENENIKGWKDKLDGLKTQFPTMFESPGKDGLQVLGDNRLPKGDHINTIPTKEEFLNMSYEQRVALKESNEQAYKQLAKN